MHFGIAHRRPLGCPPKLNKCVEKLVCSAIHAEPENQFLCSATESEANSMYYHAIAILPGDRRKSIPNKTEDQVLTEYVLPFVSSGTIKERWGAKTQSYQVLELRVYKTKEAWVKKSGIKLDDLLKRKQNLFATFEKKAKKALGTGAFRVFIIIPIQGEKYGVQDQQRIYKEYDERFEAIERLLGEYDCVAIRIDKEHPLEDIVSRIKAEIKKANFVVADLTDERPSCYFEAGYAEGLQKPVIYIASKDSILQPGEQTRIHFDIHMNVLFFTNHGELTEKLRSTIEKNKDILLAKEQEPAAAIKI